MKKLILISICLFAFSMSNEGRVVRNDVFEAITLHQSNKWEYLGEISAISQYGKNKTFVLWVKEIGGTKYFQVRNVLSTKAYDPAYSVTRGKYTFKGKEYNAKFSVSETTYYFNI